MTYKEFVDSITARIDGAVSQRSGAITAAYRQARDRIQAELDRLYARSLAGVEPTDYYRVTVQQGRLRALLAQAERSYLQAANVAGVEVDRAARASMTESYYANQYAISRGVATAQGVTVSFARLPNELIELAVTSTPNAWTRLMQADTVRFGDLSQYQAPYGTLSEMLQQRRTSDLRKVQETLVQSLAQGRNPQAAARDLDRALSITRNNAERIMRTETHRVQSLGHYASSEYAKEQGARIRRQIVSVLDDRTRPQSAQVDGQFEDEQGRFVYPGGLFVKVPGNSGVAAWDINDRETVIDVVEGLEPETRRVRNPETGRTEVISWRNYETWSRENGLTRNRYGQLL